MKSIETLSKIYSEHIWLEFTESDLQQAEATTKNYSNQTGRNYAKIACLCGNLLVKYIQDLGLSANFTAPGEIAWEVVNGTAILAVIGHNASVELQKRLVLIPSDAIDIEDFGVPQEWVDIPSWAADYYLPVQVDFTEKYLHIWGFVSRRSLKAKGEYDAISRTYYVEQDTVIASLDLLWVALDYLDEKGEVALLTSLSEDDAKVLIEQLSQPSLYSPRLEVKFEQWGALLDQQVWLEKLYQRRMERVQPQLVRLEKWFDGVVEAGWQTMEDWLNAKTLTPARFKKVRGIGLDTLEKIKRAIAQLYSSHQVALPANLKPESALVHLMQTTEDDTTCWQAAEYLWAIDPHHPDAAIRRVMDLGIQLMGYPVALMVAVLPKPNSRIGVLLRAYPTGSHNKLPPGLQLLGVNEYGASIPGLEAVARNEPQDDYISLYFSADEGDRFGVRLTLANATITEYFIV